MTRVWGGVVGVIMLLLVRVCVCVGGGDWCVYVGVVGLTSMRGGVVDMTIVGGCRDVVARCLGKGEEGAFR